jgi:hypothetical protein
MGLKLSKTSAQLASPAVSLLKAPKLTALFFITSVNLRSEP